MFRIGIEVALILASGVTCLILENKYGIVGKTKSFWSDLFGKPAGE